MQNTNINVDDTLKVEFEESDLTKRLVECKVKEIEDDRLILDYSRVSPYYYQFLHEGVEIKLYHYTEAGIDIFDSIIITSPVDQFFEVEYPPIFTRVQRRKYTRAPVKLKIQLKDKYGVLDTTETINIAGNGIKFHSSKDLVFGKMYDMFIYLDNDQIIKATGVIIKIEGNEYVFEFAKIKEKDRDKLLKLCINIQTKNINSKKNSLL